MTEDKLREALERWMRPYFDVGTSRKNANFACYNLAPVLLEARTNGLNAALREVERQQIVGGGPSRTAVNAAFDAAFLSRLSGT